MSTFIVRKIDYFCYLVLLVCYLVLLVRVFIVSLTS